MLGPSGWEALNLTLKWSKYIPVKPTPKQLAFLLLRCLDAFYGGAAGGGKSIALLMSALQYADQPDYSAILFRRKYTDLSLPGALMDLSHEWLQPTDAHWVDESKTWQFPSGASLTFGYMDSPNDHFRYQSTEFQFIGFDELTQFREKQVTYMFSRLRKKKANPIPLRFRAASNPGGTGHVWVKQRYIVEGQSHGRPFIPAKLDDNPHLDKEEYVKSLAELDPVARAQLLSGDWDAREDKKVFDRSWFQIVDAAPSEGKAVRFWDLAATEPKKGSDPDYTAGCRMLVKDGIYFITDMIRKRATPAVIEAQVKQSAELDTVKTHIFMEQEPGSSGVNTIDHYRRTVLPAYVFKGEKSTGSKQERAAPFSSQCEAGNVKLVKGAWINDFLDELESFPDGEHDDQVDAASGAYKELTNTKQFMVG